MPPTRFLPRSPSWNPQRCANRTHTHTHKVNPGLAPIPPACAAQAAARRGVASRSRWRPIVARCKAPGCLAQGPALAREGCMRVGPRAFGAPICTRLPLHLGLARSWAVPAAATHQAKLSQTPHPDNRRHQLQLPRNGTRLSPEDKVLVFNCIGLPSCYEQTGGAGCEIPLRGTLTLHLSRRCLVAIGNAPDVWQG